MFVRKVGKALRYILSGKALRYILSGRRYVKTIS
jgi:hypothetical protein